MPTLPTLPMGEIGGWAEVGSFTRVAFPVRVDGRQVARLLALHLLLRDLVARARHRHRVARVGRGLHPLLDVVGRGGRQRERVAQRHESLGELAQQHREQALLHLEIGPVGDLLRHRLVVTCLRLQGVHDRRRANLEVALGLGELLVERGLLGFREGHGVAREQHVEVRLRRAQRQVLLRLRERGLRLQHRLLRLADRDPVLHAEDRLRERDAVGLVGVVEAGRALAVEPVARHARVGRDERQVARARLRQALGSRLVLGAGALVHGVGNERVAIHGQQVRGGGREGEREGEREGGAGRFHSGWVLGFVWERPAV
jgi:hypothetical protein